MKIISIVGARPQFIKLFPLSREIRKKHTEVIIHTGQHYDSRMSQKFFSELEIAMPDYNFNINKGMHGDQTGRMIIELEKVLIKEKADLIIIFGDTNSTLAGAIAGSKLHIPILHIEAGLRSFNRQMPEEINRIVSDHVSDFLFAPTQTAMNNLKHENLSSKSYFTGDIMVESYEYIIKKHKSLEILKKYNLKKNNYYLLTLHRPYNVDNPKILSHIFKEIERIPKKIVFPIHPRTKKMIEFNNIVLPINIIITEPLKYSDFIKLQLNSHKIITDSGGVQKEAYLIKKPCITLRTETEWIETVKSGWNLLLDPNNNNLSEIIESFEPPDKYDFIFGKDVLKKMISIIDKIDE